MKTLVIVESPAKGKTISKYLGPNYTVIACYGHVVDLAKGGKFGIGIDVLNNLTPRYMLMDEKKEVFQKIIEASEDCDQIYLASDPDREGEAIAYHLFTRLASTGKPIKRVEFNEITKPAIINAINAPRDIDLKLFKAQQARRILDRLVGFMVSPFLMNVFDQNMSAGRVQSVAVRMIADREAEIKNFVPKEYWNLFADVASSNGEKMRIKYASPLANKADTDAVLAKLAGQPFVVDAVIRKPKKESPPPPLTTLMLQQIMAKKHGFSAEQTMAAAQACYEGGYTTYIRTDSVRLSDDAVKSIRQYIKGAGYNLPAKANVYEAKSTAADSHEAIRCTNVNTDPATCMLAGDEKTLYDVVWRYSVACQMEQAVFDTLEVRVSCNNEIFKISGKTLSVKGFYEVLGLPAKDKMDIPNLNVGDVLNLSKLTPEQKFTQPPARFTEANLIKELDGRQIGRPSTMATILKNINARNYVVKNGNTYHPTDLGIKVTNMLNKFFGFVNFDYSAEMEANLDKIAAGEADYDKVMTEFFKLFSNELKAAINGENKICCDKCHGIMVQREGSRGKFLACSACRNSQNIAA